jgi:hypothetical protein
MREEILQLPHVKHTNGRLGAGKSTKLQPFIAQTASSWRSGPFLNAINTGCASSRKDLGMFENLRVPRRNNGTYKYIMRDAILTKYSLKGCIFSEIFYISVLKSGVSIVYKPIYFSCPNEQITYTTKPSKNVIIGLLNGSWRDILHTINILSCEATNMQHLITGA